MTPLEIIIAATFAVLIVALAGMCWFLRDERKGAKERA